MNPKRPTKFAGCRFLAVFCAAILLPGDALACFQSAANSQAAQASSAVPPPKIPADQLDSLVAPIALYPDPLLAQVLAASTYPLEIVQLHQFLTKNPTLKDKALVDAVARQPWEPSVQAMAMLPDVVKRLAEDIQWTADLGYAFLAQQSDVMDAVQRMRKKAEQKGNLKPTEQQKVETKVIENKSVIVIEQANPQAVYVPSYDPVVVYGPPVYPYPPIYYPPPGYYYAGMAISFGVGMAIGAAWGGWGWGCGWGHNDIDIDIDNNFNRNSNRNVNRNTDRTNVGNRGANVSNRGGAGTGNNKWQHNPQHRGGAPYSDRATANKYGGTTRGDSISNRQASARQQISRDSGSLASNRGASGVSNRAGGAGVSNRSYSGGSGSRSSGSGSERIGSRDMSRSGSGSRSAFGNGNYSGRSARSSSSRGASSFGGARRGGGGGRRR